MWTSHSQLCSPEPGMCLLVLLLPRDGGNGGTQRGFKQVKAGLSCLRPASRPFSLVQQLWAGATPLLSTN